MKVRKPRKSDLEKRSKEVKQPKWDGTFRKIHRVCVTVVIVLMYLLALLSGVYQELGVYIMENNVTISKTAETIIEDVNGLGGSVLEGVEHFEVTAPKGTGNYVAMFSEEEIWVVTEMTVWESIGQIAMFTILDLATYMITLYLIKTYFHKYKKSIAALCVYQIIFLMFAWIVDAYCWQVLFGNMWMSPVQTLIRIILLSMTIYMFDKAAKSEGKKAEKSSTIQGKKSKKQ